MNLFTRIEEFVNEMQHGWCSVEKAHVLSAATIATRPATVVEIGVWSGKSLIPLAMTCQYNHFGHVIAIDPWAADASAEGMSGENLQWWGGVDHEKIYNIFLSELNRLNLTGVVEIRRCRSNDVDPPSNIGLLHIDGNHSSQAIKDVERFAPNVVVGGFTFCDDLHWDGGGVSQAVKRLTDLGFHHMYNLDTGGMFQRTEVK